VKYFLVPGMTVKSPGCSIVIQKYVLDESCLEQADLHPVLMLEKVGSYTTNFEAVLRKLILSAGGC